MRHVSSPHPFVLGLLLFCSKIYFYCFLAVCRCVWRPEPFYSLERLMSVWTTSCGWWKPNFGSLEEQTHLMAEPSISPALCSLCVNIIKNKMKWRIRKNMIKISTVKCYEQNVGEGCAVITDRRLFWVWLHAQVFPSYVNVGGKSNY